MMDSARPFVSICQRMGLAVIKSDFLLASRVGL